jgi:hypothetical protein
VGTRRKKNECTYRTSTEFLGSGLGGFDVIEGYFGIMRLEECYPGFRQGRKDDPEAGSILSDSQIIILIEKLTRCFVSAEIRLLLAVQRKRQPAEARSGYLKNRNVNHPRFSISILVPSMKFWGPCSITTTQQKVAIAKKLNQSTKRK